MLKIENTSEYNKTTDLAVSKNLIAPDRHPDNLVFFHSEQEAQNAGRKRG